MKKAIIGLVAGMLIGSAGMAAAATTQTVQAALAKFTFSVDGQKQTLKNDPLVYKGTTYLPVREVAEMTGYGLEYNNTKKSIDLKKKGGMTVTTQTDVNLDDWIPSKQAVQDYGVSMTIGKERTTISVGEIELTFPLTMTSGIGSDDSVPAFYQNADKSATLLVYKSSVYLGKDTISLLGIKL